MERRKMCTENDAMIEAYDTLINNTEKEIDDCIEKYNNQMVRDAALYIKSDLEENGFNLDIKAAYHEDKYVIKNSIEVLENKLRTLKESKIRYEKSLNQES